MIRLLPFDMNAKNFVPPLRLEIRDKSAANDASWFAFDTAQTEAQAADKLKRHRVVDTCETRLVPNETVSLAAAAQPVIQDTAATRQLLEQIQTENLALRREANSAKEQLAEFKKMPTPAPEIDALAGLTPLPFNVGDWMRDIHTGVAVRVTELNPKSKMGNPRAGFAWENLSTKPGDKDHTGWCPLASVGCFVKIKEGDPVKIDPKGTESAPPPKVQPAAQVVQAVPAAAGATSTASSETTVKIAPAPLIAAANVNRTPAPRAARTPHKRLPKPAKHTPKHKKK